MDSRDLRERWREAVVVSQRECARATARTKRKWEKAQAKSEAVLLALDAVVDAEMSAMAAWHSASDDDGPKLRLILSP